MDPPPYSIMKWGIPASARFYLKVTDGKPWPGQKEFTPPKDWELTPGYPYEYVLFNTLKVDIYSVATKTKIPGYTDIEITHDKDNKPHDARNILQFTYNKPCSTIQTEIDPKQPDNWKAWHSRYYFTVEAPNLPYWQSRPPIISNAGWRNGQGNELAEPKAKNNFWVADYGVEHWKLSPDDHAIQQLTTGTRNPYPPPEKYYGSRAYPIRIGKVVPEWPVSGGNGVAWEGCWQIAIKIGSVKNRVAEAPWCETFYLAERYVTERYPTDAGDQSFLWGPDYYSDGDGGVGGGTLEERKKGLRTKKVPVTVDESRTGKDAYKQPGAYSREIDIMETRWTPKGPQINLGNRFGYTGWSVYPDYGLVSPPVNEDYLKAYKKAYPRWKPRANVKPALWTDVALDPHNGTKDFILFGCLIRGNNLWLYAYKGPTNGSEQWYCTNAIPAAFPYIQKYPFVPYIGTWTDWTDKDGKHVTPADGGFVTKYRDFLYLPEDDPQIKNLNPLRYFSKFGWALKPPKPKPPKPI
jgi:hypothetical protein